MRRFSLALVSVALVSACSGGDTPSSPVTNDAMTVGSSSTELSSDVSALVVSTPQVTVRNSRGSTVAGVLVRWSVTSGGGRVGADSVRTNSSGVASSGGWTLGPQAGTQTLQASVSGLAPVVFTATAVATMPTRLVRVTPDLAAAPVGTSALQPPSVRAEDASGNPVANVPVTFSVIAGGGTVANAQASTNASGIATAGAWSLGTVAGMQTVRATAQGLSAADISVSTVAAAPSTMLMVAGDNQAGVAGQTIAQPPIVRIIDSFGNNVGGAPVTFTPGANSGSVTGGAMTTDPATGTAVLSAWTLGTAPSQTLIATSTALPGKSVTFRATVSSSQFDIAVRFIGDGGTDRQREAFTKAVARWRQVIVGDVGTTQLNVPAGECATWIPAINESVNDLLIYVRLSNIDGPGKVLGQATPCYVNSGNRLPIMGFFELDADDLQLLLNNGTLDDVVLHEMGHILGVGTLWSYQRTLLTGRGGEDPYFTGVGAISQFTGIAGNVYSGNPVPVENSGGAGTRDAHWRRSVFANELMQGYARPGGMPMSRVTVASLADLGYQVSFSGSDSYSFFPSIATLGSSAAGVSLGDDIARASLWEVRPNGVRRKVRELQ